MPWRTVRSIASQGMISGTNFVFSLALLYFGSPEDYVGFIVFVSALALLSSLLNAIFICPTGLMVPRMDDATIREAEMFTARGAIALSLLGLPFIYFIVPRAASTMVYAGMVVVVLPSLLLLLLRDVARNACLVREDLSVLLRVDTIYSLIACTAAMFAVVVFRIDLVVAVLAFSVPAVVNLLARPNWQMIRAVHPVDKVVRIDGHFWREVVACAQWALPGVVVAWLFTNGFWFILQRVETSEALSELGGSRLVFAPIGLAIQAWCAAFRPTAVRLVFENKLEAVWRTLKVQACTSVIGIVVLSLIAYAVVVYLPQIMPRALQSPSVVPYMFCWCVYFIINSIRNALTVACIAEKDGFRAAFRVGAVGCILFYAVMLAGLGISPILACLTGMVIAEAVMAVLLLRRLRERF